MPSHSSLLRSILPALLLVALSLCCVLPAAAIFDSAFFNSGDGDLEVAAINPAGDEVPPARQLVLRFNRPVVPVGRMEREASEIPVTITPDLACEWRWLDTSNLACQLGEKEALRPATRYTVTVRPGIKAEDGTTQRRTLTHTFVTERPRLVDYSFSTWRAPGLPVIRVQFNQPVTAASAAQHLFFTSNDGARRAAQVVEESERPATPFPDDETSEESVIPIDPELRGMSWLVSPQQELPVDSNAELRIESGVMATDGPEAGIEARTVVVFNTFPDFAFLGVQCRTNAGAELLFAPGQPPKAGQFCSPHDQVALLFSTPVAARVLGEGVKMIPTLTPVEAGPEELEYDTAIAEPHQPGKKYATYLPYWYDAYQPFTLLAAGTAIQDIFGRPLPQDIRQMFFTDHYRPSYDFAHQIAVLEKGVASEVPLEIRNLERIDLSGDALTARGKSTGLKQSLVFSEDRDKGFRVPLDLRKLLGAPSGALAGHFETIPPTANFKNHRDREFFAQITPFNVQAKVGHFNTLIWITDYATGMPVEGVETRIYRAPFPGLVANPASLAQGTSDRSGLVTLPGAEKLDPQLKNLYEWSNNNDKLFVSCRKGDDLALLPLTRDFTTGSFYDDEFGYAHLQRQYAHVRAWGMTAQGVYRAGDTIQFKLYVRNQDNRTLTPPPSAGYSLKVIDPMDQTAYEVAKLTLSEFGAYSGEFTVPANAPVGWYQFELSADFGGHWQPMQVLVSDFTPSPFKVSTELNGELFRSGETVTVATHARLHAGGPYADAGSRVVARLFPGALNSKNPLARDFSFDTWTENNATQTLHESEASVDASGDRSTSFRLDAAEVLYGRLVVESAVRDDRGKYVASEATVRFVGRTRYVGLRQPDWVLQQGKAARVEALVVDEFGEPVSGSEVKLAIRVRVTTAARVKGAGNAYLTHYEHQWVDLADFTVTPGLTMPGSATFTPDRPGLYEISATIKDTAGREHASKIERWGTGSGAVLWSGGDNNALTIIPEKQELKVGDKARYLVQNPFPGCKALITVERYGVLKSWVETFPDSTAIVEVPIEPDYVPGFYLSVTVFSPRVDKPMEGQVDLGKPAFRIGTVATPVRDPYKELVVTAQPERAVYKPREKVTVDLQVATRQKNGKAGPTELAVVVLDEAVLDLIQGGKNYYDVYKGFYRLDGLDLRTYNLLMQLVGRQKFDKKGASPGGDGGADLAMRSLFKFVAYWNPSLRTDAAGKARISFEVPDNLTGWRVLALAVTPGDRMGLGDGSFQVNRPTELRPALPNQVLEGDSFSAAFTVMNRTKSERTLTVKLSAEGAVAKPTTLEQKVVAPPYKRVELRLPVTTRGSGEVCLIARAYDKDDGDLTQAVVPVRRQIVLETATTYGTTTAASIEEKIAVPAAIRTDVGGVSVNLAPTVIGNLTGAFAYLAAGSSD